MKSKCGKYNFSHKNAGPEERKTRLHRDVFGICNEEEDTKDCTSGCRMVENEEQWREPQEIVCRHPLREEEKNEEREKETSYDALRRSKGCSVDQ